jgi:hypothetical protein
MGLFVLNALVPAIFLLVERAIFNQDPRGYLAFSHELSRIGILPPDTLLREWSVWEEAYKYARPGANFGYEAQAFVIFVIPAIFFAWHISVKAASWAARKGALIAAAVLIASLLLSLSRTGIFTFLLCCLLYVRSRHKFTIAAGAAALVAALLVAFPDNYFLQRYTMQSHDAYSFSYKFMQIFDAFKATVTQPLSLAFGNPALMDKSQGGFNPHNQFLADLMNKGLAAFILGLLVFRSLLDRLKAPLKTPVVAEDESWSRHLVGILRICIISVFIQCFSTQVLPNSNTAIMLWLPTFFLLQIVSEPKSYRLTWR